jgi:GNAT superfamily N-acetyltransferase
MQISWKYARVFISNKSSETVLLIVKEVIFMQVPNHAYILTLDQIAANTWPAPIQQPYEHWLLRAGSGVTKRANSVLTHGYFPDHTDWLDDVTDFYSRRSLPVRYHISASTDRKVDQFLEDNGFIIESPAAIYTALCKQAANHLVHEATNSYEIIIDEALNTAWLDDFLRLEQFPLDRKSAYQQIFSGIGPRTCYLRLYENGEAIGLGTAVLERGWAGFTNIVTSPKHRRKGIGAKLVQALAEWSSLNGAEHLYLQVLQDNTAAIQLYTKLGFSHAFNYHYRALL